MKKQLLIILILSIFTISQLFSQDQQVMENQAGFKRVYEFGLNFSNLNSFGINFKIGNQKTLYRFTFLDLGMNSYHTNSPIPDTIGPNQTGFAFGFRFGIEKRIDLAKNFDLHLGSDLGMSYSYYDYTFSDNNKESQWNLTPGLYLVIAVGYQLGEHFIITAELSPSLVYTYGKGKRTYPGTEYDFTNHNFAFGLSNSSASITIAYRILKTIYY